MNLLSRTDNSFLGQWWWTVDRRMLALLFAIIAFGVVLVAAASPSVAERIGLNQYHFIYRHLFLLIPATILLFGVSMLSVQNIWKLSSVVLALSILTMIYVLIFGDEIKGAQRWVYIFGFSLQPSEFVKPAFVVTAAWLIAHQKENSAFRGIFYAIGLFVLIVALLLLQPDLGMTFVVSVCFASVVFLAGLPIRWIAVLSVIAVGFLTIAYSVFPHVQSRIDRFIDPKSGDTYQIDKSLEAFQSGGLFGTGPGQGTVKSQIPDAHADFIFSVAGEELGFFFVAILIGLFAWVVVHGYNRAMDSDNMFVILATGGLITMFGLQALIHMGSSVHLLPTKGMTLPFISYGGSSLLSMGMAMGIVLGLTRRQARSGIAKTGLSVRPVGGKF